MALPAAGKGEPASAKAPVTSSTHCKLPSCQSTQQPEPLGQALAQKLQHRRWHARIVPGVRVAVEMGRDGERRHVLHCCRFRMPGSRRLLPKKTTVGVVEMLAVLVAVPGTQTPPL